MAPSATNDEGARGKVRFLPLSYSVEDSRPSALRLIYTIKPDWSKDDANIELIRFTDGITNTLLKAVNRRPGLSKTEIDREAILLRAYGAGTDILIDREREAANHELLMRHSLAPELLARFRNGMLYRFISGTVAQAKHLSVPQVSRAVARRLAQWHATVPCHFDTAYTNGHCDGDIRSSSPNSHVNGNINGNSIKYKVVNAAPGKLPPNLWTTMQKWLLALPSETAPQRERQHLLQEEFEELVKQYSSRDGYGRNGLVFAHCDLLCANIIMHYRGEDVPNVSFIDYEYGTPSPAAFDLANHFAEWAGYDCDYTSVPTVSQREEFIREYVKSYLDLANIKADEEEETRKMMHEVNVFRGLPGFYWGIWALIQATISDIKFDYASYAESRLGEYWAYKAEEDGSRKSAGQDMPIRESTWSRLE